MAAIVRARATGVCVAFGLEMRGLCRFLLARSRLFRGAVFPVSSRGPEPSTPTRLCFARRHRLLAEKRACAASGHREGRRTPPVECLSHWGPIPLDCPFPISLDCRAGTRPWGRTC